MLYFTAALHHLRILINKLLCFRSDSRSLSRSLSTFSERSHSTLARGHSSSSSRGSEDSPSYPRAGPCDVSSPPAGRPVPCDVINSSGCGPPLMNLGLSYEARGQSEASSSSAAAATASSKAQKQLSEVQSPRPEVPPLAEDEKDSLTPVR